MTGVIVELDDTQYAECVSSTHRKSAYDQAVDACNCACALAGNLRVPTSKMTGSLAR